MMTIAYNSALVHHQPFWWRDAMPTFPNCMNFIAPTSFAFARSCLYLKQKGESQPGIGDQVKCVGMDSNRSACCHTICQMYPKAICRVSPQVTSQFPLLARFESCLCDLSNTWRDALEGMGLDSLQRLGNSLARYLQFSRSRFLHPWKKKKNRVADLWLTDGPMFPIQESEAFLSRSPGTGI